MKEREREREREERKGKNREGKDKKFSLSPFYSFLSSFLGFKLLVKVKHAFVHATNITDYHIANVLKACVTVWHIISKSLRDEPN